MYAHNVSAYIITRRWRALKVTPHVATPEVELVVYDCLVLKGAAVMQLFAAITAATCFEIFWYGTSLFALGWLFWQIWRQIGDVLLPTTMCVMWTWPRPTHRCCSATPATNMATSLLMPTLMSSVSISFAVFAVWFCLLAVCCKLYMCSSKSAYFVCDLICLILLSFVKCLWSFVKISWMQQLQHTYALSRKPPGNLEMVTEFNIFQEKSGNCLGKKSCWGKLFIANFTFRATPVFYTLMLDCIACFKDYAASFIIINVYVFYSLCTGSSDICVM